MSIGKILLIEDDRDYLFMLSEMLKKRFRAEVLSVSTIDDAETLLKKEDFNLVISDIQLPGKAGTEVIQILLQLDKSVPLIFFTASDISQRTLDRHGYPCVVVNKKDHRDLMQIASSFLGTGGSVP